MLMEDAVIAPPAERYDRLTIARAMERARQRELRVTLVEPGIYVIGDYRIKVTNPRRAMDMVCNCRAGQHGLVCLHFALAAWARWQGLALVQLARGGS